jgi:RND family efflux transporter MFP subunit
MKKVLFIVLILAIAGAAFWYWHKPAAAAAEEEIKPVAAVETAVLKQQDIARAVTAYGVVEASAVGAQAITLAYDAIIREVVAPVGTRVAAGDVILKVEPTPDALLQAESAKGVAELASRSLAAVKQRYELKLATGDDLRVAEQAALDAKLKVDSYAKRGLVKESEIKAAAASIVVKLDAQPGTVVPAGTALVTLGQSANLQVRLSIEPVDVKDVQPGAVVSVTPVTRPEAEPIAVTVGTVGGLADPTTGSVDVRCPLPEGGDWIVGEHVQGLIQVEEKKALVVPRNAVLPDDEDQVLFTVKDHKAVKHTVKLGITTVDSAEVSSLDLHAGDLVVVTGNAELEDGMAVQLPGEKPKDDAPEAKDAKAESPVKADSAGDAKPGPKTDAKPAVTPDSKAESKADPKSKSEAKS